MDGVVIVAIATPIVVMTAGFWKLSNNYSRSIGRLEGKVDGLDKRMEGHEKQLEGVSQRVESINKRINNSLK